MAAVAGTTAYPDFIPKLDSKNSGLVGNIQAKLYTPFTLSWPLNEPAKIKLFSRLLALNSDLMFWHAQWIMAAVKY